MVTSYFICRYKYNGISLCGSGVCSNSAIDDNAAGNGDGVAAMRW